VIGDRFLVVVLRFLMGIAVLVDPVAGAYRTPERQT
jgi:hypothetical protein